MFSWLTCWLGMHRADASGHAPDVLEVVSIETVWAPRFFGIGAKQIGIRAWCRSRV